MGTIVAYLRGVLKSYEKLPGVLDKRIYQIRLLFKDDAPENKALGITEDDYEDYRCLLSHRKLSGILVISSLLEIMLTLINYFIIHGNFEIHRDIGNVLETFGVMVITQMIIFKPLWTAKLMAAMSTLILTTNLLPKILNIHSLSYNYDPTLQVMLWVLFYYPTGNFARSSIIGIATVVILIVFRLVHKNYSVVNILFVEGASYLAYAVVNSISQRSNEFFQRSLYVELKQCNPDLPPHKVWGIFNTFYQQNSFKYLLFFNTTEMEHRFLGYYSKQCNLELGILLSTIISSLYYLVQDFQLHKTTDVAVFIALRFAVIIPCSLFLVYCSFMRRQNPYRADFLSSVSVLCIVASQIIMFVKTGPNESSLFYLGGVMRALTFLSSQLLLTPLVFPLMASYVMIPIAAIYYLSGTFTHILFFTMFTSLAFDFSFNREKTQRIRFLIRYYKNQALSEKGKGGGEDVESKLTESMIQPPHPTILPVLASIPSQILSNPKPIPPTPVPLAMSLPANLSNLPKISDDDDIELDTFNSHSLVDPPVIPLSSSVDSIKKFNEIK
ncbi:hypothetical protein CYY_006919 [Polysphondylium violaceum]|uniref:Transmembrane protein n=1 Tax=Polysphondylium violaceum TaxID=133409 RepID=A0A8J4UYD8_9MYCE|nr:hypothetical protein CYY_006919 [Polysphondylium violaceum]